MIRCRASSRLVPLLSLSMGLLCLGSRAARAQAGDSARAVAQAGDSTLQKSAHAKLVCVACHTSLDPANVTAASLAAPVNCLRCHADAQFRHDFHPEVARAIRAGREPRVTCKECHGAHDVGHVGAPGAKFSAGRLAESCGSCHRKAVAGFRRSTHGTALTAGTADAPTCLTCHRSRITGAGITDSLSLKSAQATLCLTCHLDTPAVRAKASADTKLVARWDSSTHGRVLAHGKADAASCVGCHGSHDILKAADTASRVNRLNVTATCATCHARQETEFSASVHGLARTHANTDSLVCATCHSEHPAPSATPRVDSAAAQVCQRCHAPVALAGVYGVASDRFRDFSDSYHGLSLRGKSFTASNCASCHSAHDVRPAKDSTSAVSKASRVATCGKCHQRAIARFALGPVHDTSRTVTLAGAPAAPPPQPGRPRWFVWAAVLLAAAAATVALAVPLRRARRTTR